MLALGAMTNRKMIPGSEYAFTFKTLADAFLLRNHIIERFERADVERDPSANAGCSRSWSSAEGWSAWSCSAS